MTDNTCTCTYCARMSGNTAFFADSPDAIADEADTAMPLAAAFKAYAGAQGIVIKHQAVALNRIRERDLTTTSMGTGWMTVPEADNLRTITAHLLACQAMSLAGQPGIR
jgi:hypothetical protein